MTLSNERITYLLERYTARTATVQELQELTAWLARREDETPLHRHVQVLLDQPDDGVQHVNWDQLYAGIEEQMTDQLPQTGMVSSMPLRTVPLFRRQLVRYAAAVLLLLAGVATWYVLWRQSENIVQPVAQGDGPAITEILPGTDKAVLILADGRTIPLDTAFNGQLAQQGNVSIVKLDNGQIVYKPEGKAGNATLMNTMFTPRGAQFQLVLPDGTKVWLNAASSISYPVSFAGNKRHVKVTGEAYFEVAHRPAQPFIVDIDGKSSVEVLGTYFNINAYTNEPTVRTTLLQGSVRVSGAGSNRVILKPGQQAVMATTGDRQPSSNGISVLSGVDLDRVVAWKNGMFDFDNADIHTVMNQLERWYNIEVTYEGKVPDIVFKGEMYRNVNLSTIIEFFKGMGLHVRLEGKTLIVAG